MSHPRVYNLKKKLKIMRMNAHLKTASFLFKCLEQVSGTMVLLIELHHFLMASNLVQKNPSFKKSNKTASLVYLSILVRNSSIHPGCQNLMNFLLYILFENDKFH